MSCVKCPEPSFRRNQNGTTVPGIVGGHTNPVKDAWAASGLEPLPFPIQRLLQEPLLRAARKAGRWDLVPNLAGQVAGMISERRPAREILLELVEEAAATIEELGGTLRRGD